MTNRIPSTIVRDGIALYKASKEFMYTLPKSYNVFLDKDLIFNDTKKEFERHGFKLSCFPGGGWGNPNAPADYDISEIK